MLPVCFLTEQCCFFWHAWENTWAAFKHSKMLLACLAKTLGQHIGISRGTPGMHCIAHNFAMWVRGSSAFLHGLDMHQHQNGHGGRVALGMGRLLSCIISNWHPIWHANLACILVWGLAIDILHTPDIRRSGHLYTFIYISMKLHRWHELHKRGNTF